MRKLHHLPKGCITLAEYGIWISFDNQREGFELPILPREIGSSTRGDGSEHDVYGLGKINVIKDRGLSAYTIESFFPAQRYPFITSSIVLEPMAYIEYVMRWWESKRPVRFVAVTSTMEINTAASIEGFEWKEVAGAPGDIQYTLALKEYKFYAARNVVRDQREPQVMVLGPSPNRPDDRVPPKTYTMVAGDTLWKVAQKVLGNGARWKEIQTLNNIKDSEIKRLPIGKVLKLPPVGGNVA